MSKSTNKKNHFYNTFYNSICIMKYHKISEIAPLAQIYWFTDTDRES